MTDTIGLVSLAIEKGGILFGSISGGKDGQAMVRVLRQNGYSLQGLIHCDLGRAEWRESLPQCEKQAVEYGLQLDVLRRSDGLGLVEYMKKRLSKLKGTGKPFWPSSQARYCTSDLKREPSDQFFRRTGASLIISCEGIRAEESTNRRKKKPLSVRTSVSSSFYKLGPKKWMTAEQAIAAYNPNRRLVLNWYPVFHYTIEEVWNTYGMTSQRLQEARTVYKLKGIVPDWWPFHPTYAYGNSRVSCVFCILGSDNDLKNGATHRPELLEEYESMEVEGSATFKHKFSLKELTTKTRK